MEYITTFNGVQMSGFDNKSGICQGHLKWRENAIVIKGRITWKRVYEMTVHV